MTHPTVEAYLDAVCAEIRCTEVHVSVRAELLSHIQAIADSCRETGLAEEEAVKHALARMGDAADVGHQLHQTHRPRTEWGLIAATCVLGLVGLWAMYALDAGSSHGQHYGPLFSRQLGWVALGLVAGTVLYFADYRWLKPAAWPLYALGLLLAYTPWQARTQHGVLGSLADNAALILAVGLAGLFARWDWYRRLAVLKGLLLTGLPIAAFCMAPDMSGVVTYLVAAGAIVLTTKPNRSHLWLAVGSGAALGATFAAWIFSAPYRTARLLGWIMPGRDPAGKGYQSLQLLLAVQEGGFWGQGATAVLNELPESHGEFLFPYLVYTLGWLAGIVICIAALWFVARWLHIRRRIKEPFGAAVVTGIGTIFAFQIAWNLLMAVALLPAAAMRLPFVSAGPGTVLSAAAVGLALSVFRRKDLQALTETGRSGKSAFRPGTSRSTGGNP